MAISGSVTESPLPSMTCGFAMTAGPDGNIWFTLVNSTGTIGRITPAGSISIFLSPDSITASQPAIAPRPDGTLWFTDLVKLNRVTTAGAISVFPQPPPSVEPFGITLGPDGNMWFTDLIGHRIGRFTPPSAPSPTPVPSTLTLFGCALTCLIAWRSRVRLRNFLAARYV